MNTHDLTLTQIDQLLRTRYKIVSTRRDITDDEKLSMGCALELTGLRGLRIRLKELARLIAEMPQHENRLESMLKAGTAPAGAAELIAAVPNEEAADRVQMHWMRQALDDDNEESSARGEEGY